MLQQLMIPAPPPAMRAVFPDSESPGLMGVVCHFWVQEANGAMLFLLEYTSDDFSQVDQILIVAVGCEMLGGVEKMRHFWRGLGCQFDMDRIFLRKSLLGSYGVCMSSLLLKQYVSPSRTQICMHPLKIIITRKRRSEIKLLIYQTEKRT